MNLVAYSDSEESDTEPTPAHEPAPNTTTKSASKSAKLVESSTRKVKVNISALVESNNRGDTAEEARPAKRARVGGGGLNINAFLPAPKRPAATLNGNDGSETAGKAGLGKGLGRGINLRTGAEPAFTREQPKTFDMSEEPKDIKDVIAELRARPSAVPKDADTSNTTTTAQVLGSTKPAETEVKLIGSAMRFKPLSVARNAQKKKKKISAPATSMSTVVPASGLTTVLTSKSIPTKPKVSLFSLNPEEATGASSMVLAEEYNSTIYKEEQPLDEDADGAFDELDATANSQSLQLSTSTVTQTGPQTLDAITKDLNLSAADMRQLFGRKAGKSKSNIPDLASISVVNFDTDAEYAANEELRARGETVAHNPVRAIAPGKHSLKQLVNAAATQKDALEEHFAQGKRNQREAGSRYGW